MMLKLKEYIREGCRCEQEAPRSSVTIRHHQNPARTETFSSRSMTSSTTPTPAPAPAPAPASQGSVQKSALDETNNNVKQWIHGIKKLEQQEIDHWAELLKEREPAAASADPEEMEIQDEKAAKRVSTALEAVLSKEELMQLAAICKVEGGRKKRDIADRLSEVKKQWGAGWLAGMKEFQDNSKRSVPPESQEQPRPAKRVEQEPETTPGAWDQASILDKMSETDRERVYQLPSDETRLALQTMCRKHITRLGDLENVVAGEEQVAMDVLEITSKEVRRLKFQLVTLQESEIQRKTQTTKAKNIKQNMMKQGLQLFNTTHNDDSDIEDASRKASEQEEPQIEQEESEKPSLKSRYVFDQDGKMKKVGGGSLKVTEEAFHWDPSIVANAIIPDKYKPRWSRAIRDLAEQLGPDYVMQEGTWSREDVENDWDKRIIYKAWKRLQAILVDMLRDEDMSSTAIAQVARVPLDDNIRKNLADQAAARKALKVLQKKREGNKEEHRGHSKGEKKEERPKEERACWICGSHSHLKKDCPRAKN